MDRIKWSVFAQRDSVPCGLRWILLTHWNAVRLLYCHLSRRNMLWILKWKRAELDRIEETPKLSYWCRIKQYWATNDGLLEDKHPPEEAQHIVHRYKYESGWLFQCCCLSDMMSWWPVGNPAAAIWRISDSMHWQMDESSVSTRCFMLIGYSFYFCRKKGCWFDASSH